MPNYDSNVQNGNSLKVKLREHGRVGTRRRTIVFQATPDLTEESSVNYTPIEIVHAPAEMYIYKNTPSRTWNIQVPLVSRTRDEATINLARLNLLRSWRMPVFGSTRDVTNNIQQLSDDIGSEQLEAIRNDIGDDDLVLGAPPPVLQFSAYSDASHRGHLYKVRTVLTQFSTNYQSDVDYIPTGYGTKGYEEFAANVPMPTIMSLNLTLAETHAPDELSKFNLSQYRLGVLEGF